MNASRLVSLVALAACGIVAAQHRPVGVTDAVRALRDTCEASLAGWRYGPVIPAYLAWESFFTSLLAHDSSILRPLDIPATARDKIETRAREAVNAAAAIRSPRSGLLGTAERDAAFAIVAARDDLIRTLPQYLFDRISQAVDAQSGKRSFQLPAIGKLRDVHGLQLCSVDIKGREHPHLIPEPEYWESYFRVRTITADSFRTGRDSYAPEHIVALQSLSLPIAAQHVRDLLVLAATTTKTVDAMKQGGNPDVAAVVLGARADLIRTLPPHVWAAIDADAGRLRAGYIFTYYVNQ